MIRSTIVAVGAALCTAALCISGCGDSDDAAATAATSGPGTGSGGDPSGAGGVGAAGGEGGAGATGGGQGGSGGDPVTDPDPYPGFMGFDPATTLGNEIGFPEYGIPAYFLYQTLWQS